MKKRTIWVLGIIGFILICFCCLFFKIPSIESELITNAETALTNAGINIDSISISGRDVTLHGIVSNNNIREKAEEIVNEVWGINSVINNLKILEKENSSPSPKAEIEKVQKKLDDAIDIASIEFETGSSVIKQNSLSILDNISKILFDNPEIKISVNGHTDSKGNADKNNKLSKSRAESVKNYLVKSGIGNNRISAFGFGSSQPIADNNTLEGRQKNRRVEFKIIQEN